MKPKPFAEPIGDRMFGLVLESADPNSGIAAIVGCRNQAMSFPSKKRMNLTKRRPTGSAFDTKETLFTPRATCLNVKFIIFLLRQPVTCDSVSAGHDKRTDTTNLMNIRGVISITFLSLAADRVHVWEVSSLFSAPSPQGESDTPPPVVS